MMQTLQNLPERVAIRKSLRERCRLPLMLTVRPTGYFEVKPIFDYSMALILLVPGLPLMAVVMVLVWLTSPGPVIYRQRRVGQYGLTFWMLKIRTMTHNAEVSTGPIWARSEDPRVTAVGYWLRVFHLDELPQLFNVLRGEMSIVGPRPERPEFVEILSRKVPGYLNRLAVRPGITGLAQLNLPPDSDIISVHRKLVLDLEYIRTASMHSDLLMIFCTILRLGKIPVIELFGLKRNVNIPFELHESDLHAPRERCQRQFELASVVYCSDKYPHCCREELPQQNPSNLVP
jgi:lipopolysaccharide/colanic/teichoic acid biosynthesis glycosyltransferase